MYTEKIGIDRFTSPHHRMMSLSRHAHGRSPETYLFGAYTYCLKNNDREAAQLIEMLLDEMKKERR